VCNYDSEFIIRYRDSVVSQEEKEKFELHLLDCETCRRKVALDKKLIDFLKSENSATYSLNKSQVMSNIDLNKYDSGKGNLMAKLVKWKSISIKVAAVLVVCIGGIALAQINPVREGLKTISLNILDKRSRLYDNTSEDIIPASTPKPSIPVISSNGILPNYVDLDKLPESYTVDDAKKDGCVVFEGLFLTSGETEWESFLEMTQKGQPAKIRLVHYSENADFDFNIIDLLFDGKTYYVAGKKGIANQYKYINHYSSETYDYYVLSNIKDISLEQLSKSFDIINCSFIYTNHYRMPKIDIKSIWPNYTSCHELPEDYTIEDAKRDGCVVIENFSFTSGETEWEDFLELTKKCISATIRIVSYYQNDTISELTIKDLLFDGSTYYVIQKDGIAEQYKYLKHYPLENGDKYILCDIKDISWDEIFHSLLSSDLRNHIRYKYIFSINRE